MKIQILGTGCPKCKQLEKNTHDAVTELGIDADISKVTDIDEIMNMGVMITPALAIDDDVKSTGKLLTKEQVMDLLKGSN